MFSVHETHYPVLLREVIEALQTKNNGFYIDATFGGGGYTRAILDSANCYVDAVDRDHEEIQRSEYFKKRYGSRFSFYAACFGNLDQVVPRKNYDGIVFDLGVSSYQIDQPERGFSFRFNGPLDMRMGSNNLSAEEVVNNYSQEDLADIIYHYGEERSARRVARAIVEARKKKFLTTTFELADVVRSVVPRTKNIDPATLTFQGLRIFVNNELIEIDKALKKSLSLLNNGGKVVVVSFHGLEDRVVKNNFRSSSYKTDLFEVVYKSSTSKAIKPQIDEIKNNPRSRSAKMRCAYAVFKYEKGSVSHV